MNLRINKSTLGIALSALLLGAPMIAHADQTSDMNSLQQQILQLQRQLDQLEANQKATDDTLQKAVKASDANVNSKSGLKLTISGLLQVDSYLNLSGNGSQGNDTFRLRRGEIHIDAQITPRISSTIFIDAAKTNINSPNRANAMLQQLSMTYMLNKDKSNANYVDVGQVKLPMSYEGMTSSSALPLVERSMLFTQGNYGNVYDDGVQLHGNVGKLEYIAGMFNGLGIDQNTNATRDSKAFAGRILWKAADGFQVGGSLAKESNSGNVSDFFANYTKNKWWVSGEYAKGSNFANILQRNGNGFNLTAGYHLSPKLEAVARYDKFNDTSSGNATENTLGLNYYIKGNNAKIQLNLVKHDGPLDSSNGQGYSYDWTELRTGFQVAF